MLSMASELALTLSSRTCVLAPGIFHLLIPLLTLNSGLYNLTVSQVG